MLVHLLHHRPGTITSDISIILMILYFIADNFGFGFPQIQIKYYVDKARLSLNKEFQLQHQRFTRFPLYFPHL